MLCMKYNFIEWWISGSVIFTKPSHEITTHLQMIGSRFYVAPRLFTSCFSDSTFQLISQLKQMLILFAFARIAAFDAFLIIVLFPHWPYLVVSAGGGHPPPHTSLCHAHPPATHTPPPCTPPCHACLPPHTMHATHPVDRILDTRFWKYYLAPTSLRAVIILMLPNTGHQIRKYYKKHTRKFLSHIWDSNGCRWT